MHKVSVVMPVYNGKLYLDEAIRSILGQTFSEFEFIIINDCSTDNTSEIINHYQDSRIHHVQLVENKGIINALNIGLAHTRGEYIIRMDADDIAYPDRIEKQVQYMDQFPEIGVSGSGVEYFGKRHGIVKAQERHADIVWSMLYGSPFYHPTVIMRKKILIDHGIFYPKEFLHAEDYALWYEMMDKTRFGNIQEPLLKYRYVGDSVSSRHWQTQQEMTQILQRKVFSKLFGEEINDDDWNQVHGREKVNIKRVMGLFDKINYQHLFSDEEFHKRVIVAVKKLIAKNGADGESVRWLLRSLPNDLGYLKYVLLSLSRNLFKTN